MSRQRFPQPKPTWVQDGEVFVPVYDPPEAEFRADNVVSRLRRNARELDTLQRRAGGLILGSMSSQEAFRYLQDAENRIATARALVEEQRGGP